MHPPKHHPEASLVGFERNCELFYRVSVGFVALQVEHSIHDRIHAAIGAGKQVQALLQHEISFLRLLGIHEKPFE